MADALIWSNTVFTELFNWPIQCIMHACAEVALEATGTFVDTGDPDMDSNANSDWLSVPSRNCDGPNQMTLAY